MSDSNVARGERWIIITLLSVIIYNQGVQMPTLLSLLIGVTAAMGLYYLSKPWRARRGDSV